MEKKTLYQLNTHKRGREWPNQQKSLVGKLEQKHFNEYNNGSGCGSVGRAVTSNTRDPRFESSQWQNFITDTSTVENTEEKTKINKKGPGIAHS